MIGLIVFFVCLPMIITVGCAVLVAVLKVLEFFIEMIKDLFKSLLGVFK